MIDAEPCVVCTREEGEGEEGVEYVDGRMDRAGTTTRDDRMDGSIDLGTARDA